VSPLAYPDVRARTEALAAVLSPEDQTVQSMPDVSPTKWHRAHTTWFFETFLLVPSLAGYDAFDPSYAYLFNSYYEAAGPRHSRVNRGQLSRPGIVDIASYRTHVDAAMGDLLDADPSTVDKLAPLVQLGLHHEQQHQELLLMDIKHVLSVNPLRPAYCAGAPGLHPVADAAPAPLAWHPAPGGVVGIGSAADGFSYDNERPRHDALLQPHEVADRLVTAGDWLSFMADGGYARPELWMSDGWATVQAEGWEAPLYWEADGTGWSVFTLGGLVPVDPTAPVCHVSWYEADAFARWSGARLPWEAEWEQAAPEPALPGATEGPGGWYGQVWQWTASPYSPYPGFAPDPGAVGEYNGKFMVNQQVLRGSCCVTSPGHARRTYRNFFPPSARWPFTGLRLARDA
jgi:ergothioneine biosynthesis protein EgtB